MLDLPHVVHSLRSLTVLYARFIDALNAHFQLCFLRSLARQALETKQLFTQETRTCTHSNRDISLIADPSCKLSKMARIRLRLPRIRLDFISLHC